MTDDSDQLKVKLPFLPYGFIFFPIAITILLAGAGWLLQLNDTLRIQAIWTLIGILLGLTVTILLRHVELNRSITNLQNSVISNANDISRLTKANQRISRLEASLESDHQFKHICAINDSLGVITATCSKMPRVSELIKWKEERLLVQSIEAFRELSDGVVLIDDTRKELNTNEDFLRNIPTHTVSAVSFEDEAFWKAPEGASFLRAHQEVTRDKRVKITRIFIIDRDESEYAATFDQQIAHGVELHYLKRDMVPDLKPEDFVVYDHSAVRIGFHAPTSSPSGSAVSNKFSRLDVREGSIKHYVETFDSLLKRSFRPKALLAASRRATE